MNNQTSTKQRLATVALGAALLIGLSACSNDGKADEDEWGFDDDHTTVWVIAGYTGTGTESTRVGTTGETHGYSIGIGYVGLDGVSFHVSGDEDNEIIDLEIDEVGGTIGLRIRLCGVREDVGAGDRPAPGSIDSWAYYVASNVGEAPECRDGSHDVETRGYTGTGTTRLGGGEEFSDGSFIVMTEILDLDSAEFWVSSIDDRWVGEVGFVELEIGEAGDALGLSVRLCGLKVDVSRNYSDSYTYFVVNADGEAPECPA